VARRVNQHPSSRNPIFSRRPLPVSASLLTLCLERIGVGSAGVKWRHGFHSTLQYSITPVLPSRPGYVIRRAVKLSDRPRADPSYLVRSPRTRSA
jgi:hypothetical protein